MLHEAEQRAVKIKNELSDLTIFFETRGKEQVEAALASLSKLLESKYVAFEEAFQKYKRHKGSNQESELTRYLRQLDDVMASASSQRSQNAEQFKKGITQHIENGADEWQRKSNAKLNTLEASMETKIRQFRLRREENGRKLEEALNKLSELAEDIPCQFIQ